MSSHPFSIHPTVTIVSMPLPTNRQQHQRDPQRFVPSQKAQKHKDYEKYEAYQNRQYSFPPISDIRGTALRTTPSILGYPFAAILTLNQINSMTNCFFSSPHTTRTTIAEGRNTRCFLLFLRRQLAPARPACLCE